MVQVGGDDWREMQRRVGSLESKYAALENQVAGLGTQQLALHKVTRETLEKLKCFLKAKEMIIPASR